MDREQELSGLLVEAGYLPKDPASFNAFHELESQIAAHVCQGSHDKSGVVNFDGECIDDPLYYHGVLKLFIDATAQPDIFKDLDVTFEPDSATVHCSVKKRGKLVEAQWQQPNDWVTAEAIDFALKVTRGTKGWFFPIQAGGQNYVAIWVSSALGKSLQQYKKDSEQGRESFLTGTHPQDKCIFAKIPILPRNIYRDVMRRFYGHYLTAQGLDLRDLGSYKKGVAEAYPFTPGGGEAEFPLETVQHMKMAEPPLQRCVRLRRYHFAHTCPDEEAYVVSLARPTDEIVFSLPARRVSERLGERTEDIGPYAVIGKDADWAIVVDTNADPIGLIAVGDKARDGVSPYVVDANSANAAEYAHLRQAMVSMLEQQGFIEYGTWRRDPGAYYDRGFNKVDLELRVTSADSLTTSRVRLSFGQETLDDPIAIELVGGRTFKPIEDLFHHSAQILFAVRGPLRSLSLDFAEHVQPRAFSLESGPSADMVINQVLGALQHAIDWAKRDIGVEDYLAICERQGLNADAAAVHLYLGDTDKAIRLMRQHVEQHQGSEDEKNQLAYAWPLAFSSGIAMEELERWRDLIPSH